MKTTMFIRLGVLGLFMCMAALPPAYAKPKDKDIVEDASDDAQDAESAAEEAEAHPIDERRPRMEDALNAERAASARKKQAEGSEQGAQKKAQTTLPAPATSHLNLTVQIDEAGNAEITHVTEVPGDAALSDEPLGDYVYAVSSDDKTVAVQAMPDPFETRSFPGPEGSPMEEQHMITRTKTAIITIKIPKMTLTRAAAVRMGIRIFKITPGVVMEKVNPGVIDRLRQQNQLEMKIDLPAEKMMPAIREKGIRAVPQQ